MQFLYFDLYIIHSQLFHVVLDSNTMHLLSTLIIFVIVEKSCCALNFIITNWTQCDNTPIKLQVHYKMLNETYQLVDADYSSPVDNGDKFQITIDTEYKRAKSWIHLFHIKDNSGVCKTLERLGGEVFQDIRRSAGVSTKCPIPSGNHKLRNYRVKYDRLNFPFPIPQAKFRLHFRLHEKSTKKLSMCLDFEVNSKPLF